MKEQSTSRLHGLDTLRALAIGLVMLFHLWAVCPDALQPVARFGWMGVDLFFVLSGYLIGSQLLKPYLRGEVPGLGDFYRRRLYRILPAYLTVLTLYFCVPGWREAPGISPLWEFLTFTENLFVDYGVNQAFSHVWSLCVEEHFYLLLPVLVLWLMRRPAMWKTVAVFGSLLVLGICVRGFVLVHTLRPLAFSNDGFGVAYIERIYYPTYCRIDGLLAGLGLAVLKLFRPGWWRIAEERGHALLLSGAGLVALAVYLFKDRFDSVTGVAAVGTVMGFPILSLGLGLMVASAISRNGLLRRFPVPGARLVATLAFSLYLTHKEIIHLDQRLLPHMREERSWAALGVYAVTCMAAAAVLYLCVERPFMLLRDRRANRRVRDVESEVRGEPAL